MGTITVIISDTTGSKEQAATVPVDAPAIRLVAKLTQLLELPVAGPDGMPLSYKFHHRNGGRQLRDEETLASAGVREGDMLRLVAEITAGRSC